MSELLQKNDFLNQKDVANMLNVKVSTLNHWRCVKRYDIPHVKLGRVILYPEKAFKEWLSGYTHNLNNWD